MSVKNIRVSSKFPSLKSTQVTVAGVSTEGAKLVVQSQLEIPGIPTHEDLKRLGVSSAWESVSKVFAADRVILLVGMGDQAVGANELRELAGTATRASLDASELVFNLPNANAQEALAIAEGAA